METTALITNDGIIFGLLAVILGAIFYTQSSSHPFFQKLYKWVPALLLCYFIPSLLNTFGIVDGASTGVYPLVMDYLLPACLVLLTLSLDLKAIVRLGPKLVILFLVGTLGIVIGGPIALLLVSLVFPELLNGAGPDAVWRGMTTIAGSWIGGGANQAAMKEVYEVGGEIFSAMVTVDIIVANLWMAVLLYMAANSKAIDARIGADTSAIETIKERMEHYQAQHNREAKLPDLMFILAVAFGVTGIAHWGADVLAPFIGEHLPLLKDFSLDKKFFWLIVIATTVGVILSFTPARKLEGVGASKFGSLFVYILVATIGLHMDVTAILDSPKYFLIGAIWMLIHASLMLITARLLKAPVFYMAVGSQANVGGAASAPVVASAFHPSLAPVGVLLAVFGYALGTYMAYICGQILRVISAG
ncbi:MULTISPECIES: DUF819 domain-containing protein [Pseudidiomarina]|uniref:Membrane protein n=3 Tax=Pseudidiomarina TaxID=2800384 RepID=A0A368V8E9_9GAMM|nr:MULTISPECIES: DUF819 family protein [Pseudidiomarina]MDX1524788.1 DUF819 family protein [Pseudidiomarina maritima]PWW15996.1 putative membrane protein [Pseudidiomarina maritima]RBP93494.1 putative membrane protein [Pseudidiomarina tainanensis]RCW35954.1 putative membrane protein [Pseudidiomarina tainanensis]